MDLPFISCVIHCINYLNLQLLVEAAFKFEGLGESCIKYYMCIDASTLTSW